MQHAAHQGLVDEAAGGGLGEHHLGLGGAEVAVHLGQPQRSKRLGVWRGPDHDLGRTRVDAQGPAAAGVHVMATASRAGVGDRRAGNGQQLQQDGVDALLVVGERELLPRIGRGVDDGGRVVERVATAATGAHDHRQGQAAAAHEPGFRPTPSNKGHRDTEAQRPSEFLCVSVSLWLCWASSQQPPQSTPR